MSTHNKCTQQLFSDNYFLLDLFDLTGINADMDNTEVSVEEFLANSHDFVNIYQGPVSICVGKCAVHQHTT